MAFLLENGFDGVLTGVKTCTCPSLMRRAHADPLGRMQGACRVVIGCVQPDGWKKFSANLNGCWFTEWR